MKKYDKDKENKRDRFKLNNWLKPKQRLLLPYRIAIKCQNELGLVLRNDIKWIKQYCNFKTGFSKGSSMPTGAKDRLNTNSEALFLFTKQRKYFFNLDNVGVPYKTKKKDSEYIRNGNQEYREIKSTRNPHGKNPGDCIMFPIEPSKEKHFAMFPSTLPEFCIKAGCPQKVCKECGKPLLVRETKKEKVIFSCDCNAGYNSGIVLDPFTGSGTSLIAAKKLGRRFIGFDLNQDYVKCLEGGYLMSIENKDISSDIGNEIITKLKEILAKLNKILEEDGKELSDSFVFRNKD